MAYDGVYPRTVPQGGTGIATTTAYGLIAGGTTATGVFQTVTPAAANTVVKSGGTGALHSYTTNFKITSDVMTNTSQPAFLAYLGTSDASATGAGTLYTLGGGNALTIVFDQSSNLTTGGTFTAPVTGRYSLSSNIRLGSLTVAMTFVAFQIVTSNATYSFSEVNCGIVRTVAIAADLFQTYFSVLADMDAADTFQVKLAVSGGAGNTASVSSDGTRIVFMCGHLVC